jgi:uncharacterized membrane protein YraQ (UPF0718 family)
MKKAIIKAAKSLLQALPIIAGTILLISLITNVLSRSFYTSLFQKNILLDPLIGSLVGSISAGNPITSYILGGEFLDHGISLLAITSFLVAWVTVGLIQLPAESSILGKKFAIMRNVTAFFLAIVVAIITTLILGAF